MSVTSLHVHPFRRGVMNLLGEHFHPDIVKRFKLEFELNMYELDEKRTPGLINQRRDKNYVMEVRYLNQDGTEEYICDVYSWESKKQTELRLLQFITDKVKAGKIGQDWEQKDGKLVINPVIQKGDYATPDEPTGRDPNPTRRLHRRRKGNK